MKGTKAVGDRFFAEIISLNEVTSSENAAAVALAIIDGAARGYLAVRSEAPGPDVTRALIKALGVEPASVASSFFS